MCQGLVESFTVEKDPSLAVRPCFGTEDPLFWVFVQVFGGLKDGSLVKDWCQVLWPQSSLTVEVTGPLHLSTEVLSTSSILVVAVRSLSSTSLFPGGLQVHSQGSDVLLRCPFLVLVVSEWSGVDDVSTPTLFLRSSVITTTFPSLSHVTTRSWRPNFSRVIIWNWEDHRSSRWSFRREILIFGAGTHFG